MDIARAREIVSALAEGIDPTTGEILPEDSVCSKGDVVRALYAVLGACSQKEACKKTQQKEPENYDAKLYERLRVLRNKIAEEKGLTPFRVSTNVSLMHMAAQMPVTPEEFLNTYGVGKHTAKQYGQRFITEIKNFLNSQALQAKR